jgi:aldehyde:ferredoxin oxidoreductase
MYGYTGKLLRVNLSSGESKVEPILEPVMKDFLGGRGLGVRYLYQELSPGIDPLGAENKLLFLMGPLGGTPALGFSKIAVVTKSPLTGGVTKSIGGGYFGAFLKFAGFDALIVEGGAQHPVYIYIEDGSAKLVDAVELWGLDTQETQQKLQQRHGQRTKTACIGPAGEKLVRYSAIISDLRAAARGGVGAVMGAKRLKAVAINPTGSVALHNTEEFRRLVREQVEGLKNDKRRALITQFGTAYMTLPFAELGIYPTYNFRKGTLKGIERLSGEEFARFKVKNYGCYGCMTRCGQVRQVTEGQYAGAMSDGPEYETICTLGGQVGNNDPASLIAIDNICDRLGIDTISTGVCIAFACELFEKGIINLKDTDGLDLHWGNHQDIIKMVKKIGRREGLGQVLGEGVKRAAEYIGNGAENFAMHVKGSEIPGYEPRAVKGYGLIYATSNIGANHMYGRPRQELDGKLDPLFEKDKGRIMADAEFEQAVSDSLIRCNFGATGLSPELRNKLLVAATGFEELGDSSYLNTIGERIVCLERAFNVREGFSRQDDNLPLRMLKEPLIDAGPATGQRMQNLQGLLDEYYEAVGYSHQGIPSRQKLRELGLDWVIKDAEFHGKLCG